MRGSDTFERRSRPCGCEQSWGALSSSRGVRPPGQRPRLTWQKETQMFGRNRSWLNWFTRTLAVVLLVAACGASALAPAAAQAPVVLKMARNAEPGIFIPWLIDDNTALFTLGNVYDGLLRVTKDGAGVEPALATKWETSADGLTWTFTLRQGVKFSDGSPLTSNDVKTSLDLAWCDGQAHHQEGQLQGHHRHSGARSGHGQNHGLEAACAAVVGAGDVPRLDHEGRHGNGDRSGGL